MKNKLIYGLLMVALAVSCGRSGARSQQQYETVEEGSAAGVTSTIHGPGETLPPITGTNADTTTAFTLDPNGVPTTTTTLAPTNTVAGSYPPGTWTPPPNPVPAQQPQPVTRQPVPPAPQPPAHTQPPEMAPPTETAEPEPPPATDTSTTTQPPTDTDEKPPTNTSGTEEPPPPPPPPPVAELLGC